MSSKLTLRVDDEVIKSAKLYSKKRGKSLSKIVSDYLRLLEKDDDEFLSKITPDVKSLKGILKGVCVDENDYKKYLEEKYL